MKPNKGARFDVFTNISYGRHAQELPSNEEIRKRNFEEYKRDLAAEEKANAEAAALAQRNAEEEELGIHSTMNEVRAASAHENEALRKRWAHSFKSIANFVAFDENDPAGNILAHSYYDKFHTMPHVTEPVAISGEEAQKAALNFFERLEHVQGVVLDDDSKSKIMLYVGLVAFVDKLIDPRLTSCWNAAYERLANELQVLNVTRKSQPTAETKATPEITDYTSRQQDEQILGEQFVGEAGSWINAWSDSVRQNFGIVMTTDQKRKALDYIVNVLDGQWNQHSSWDKARRHLARTGVLVCADGTLPLTQKEIIEEKMDKLRLDVPAERQEYLKLANYLNHNEI